MAFSTHLSWMSLAIALLLSVLANDISAQCTSELSVSISNVSPRSGAFVQLSCNVSSANFDMASWYQGETILVMGVIKLVDNPRVFLPGEVNIGDGCYNYGLGIVNISPEDAGEYTCRIGNATSTAVAVDVIVTPDAMYPTCQVELRMGASAAEDATVSLACRTQTGNPPWSPTWGSKVPGGSENVSMSGEFTTSLLELPATPEVLLSTFTCSAACNSSNLNCLPSDMRSCSIDGLFSPSPVQQLIDAGGSANYTCKTSIGNSRVFWIVPEELQMTMTVNTQCSIGNTSCKLILANVDPLTNGTQIPCALSQVGSNEVIVVSSVTIVVALKSSTNTPTMKQETTLSPVTSVSTGIGTIATSVPTTVSPSASTLKPTMSKQPPTTPFITPPPPPPPTSPFVATTPRPTTINPTTLPTTTLPVITSTTTTPATIASATITYTTAHTTRTSSMSRTFSPKLSPTLTSTTLTLTPNASAVTPTPDSGQNSSSGVSVGEIIAIVVTISILLIVLIMIFAFMLVRRNASSENRGKLRRDAAMLDSQAPSPFNAYDMQTVLGGKDTKEMSEETEEKSGVNESMGYLLPIPDLDAEDDVDDHSFDNPAFDKDSALYASIPSKSNSVNERLYQNIVPPTDERYQNGSIDQGYYEHYPDPDLGGDTRIVHGVISTVL